MKHPFELAPLLVAAVAGAVILYVIANSQPNNAETSTSWLLLGAITGVGVQLAVRVTGVS